MTMTKQYHSVYFQTANGLWHHEASRDSKVDALDDKYHLQGDEAVVKVKILRDDGSLETIRHTLHQFEQACP